VASAQVGVHMAVSPDQFRAVYTQGHPEYDANSLLKEYKREVFRFLNGEQRLLGATISVTVPSGISR
jgi:homoserine O-succinyltransferase